MPSRAPQTVTIALTEAEVDVAYRAGVEHSEMCRGAGIPNLRTMSPSESLQMVVDGYSVETAVTRHLGIAWQPRVCITRDPGWDAVLVGPAGSLKLAIKGTSNPGGGCVWDIPDPRRGVDTTYLCDAIIFALLDNDTMEVTLRAGSWEDPTTWMVWNRYAKRSFHWCDPKDMTDYVPFHDQLLARVGFCDLRAAG